MESTTAIFYIVYNKNKNKNLITDRWMNVFGFSGLESEEIFKDKCSCIISEKQNTHYNQIKKLKVGETKKFLYQIQNKKTGHGHWAQLGGKTKKTHWTLIFDTDRQK